VKGGAWGKRKAPSPPSRLAAATLTNAPSPPPRLTAALTAALNTALTAALTAAPPHRRPASPPPRLTAAPPSPPPRPHRRPALTDLGRPQGPSPGRRGRSWRAHAGGAAARLERRHGGGPRPDLVCLVLPQKLHAGGLRPLPRRRSPAARRRGFGLVCSLAEGKAAELAEQAGLVETVHLYLVDEVTGEPVVGPGYPIEITNPNAWLTQLAPFFKAGLSRLWAWPSVAARGSPARFFLRTCPVIPAGARQAASSAARRLGAVCRRRAAGSGEQRRRRGPRAPARAAALRGEV
jgi:hypothetical protein